MSEEFKPKEVEYTPQSREEIEREVVEAAENREIEAETEAEVEVETEVEVEQENKGEVEIDLSDDKVLSFINKQRGSQFNSIEEMLTPAQIQQEEDEAILAFSKYRKETGRSIEDYVKLGKDYTKEDPDNVLRSYYADINSGLSRDDIDFQLNEQFGRDEDDEERDIRRKEVAKKLEVSKAIRYYNEQKEQYNVPLVSTAPIVPEEEKESYSAFRKHQQDNSKQQGHVQAVKEHFSKSTNDLFSDKFEGFKFNVNADTEITYKIENVEKVKTSQSDARNFINNHVDENGMIKDAAAYHKAIFAANDPDGFAKHFYELGAAAAIKADEKKAKNIDMSPRNTDGTLKINGEFKPREVSQNTSGLMITPPRQRE